MKADIINPHEINSFKSASLAEIMARFPGEHLNVTYGEEYIPGDERAITLMSQNIDVETRCRLRTFSKPAVTPIMKAISLAFIMHVLIGFYINYEQEQAPAELSDWVNIKLIAGFDEDKSKNINQKNTTHKKQVEEPKIKQIARKKRQLKQENIKNNRQEKEQEKKSASATGTTTVKASNHPFINENPKPVYPAVARRRGIQGMVLLDVEVNAVGRVNRIKILQSSGFRMLDIAAIQSVEQWRFKPGSKGGINIASSVNIPVRFSLQ